MGLAGLKATHRPASPERTETRGYARGSQTGPSEGKRILAGGRWWVGVTGLGGRRWSGHRGQGRACRADSQAHTHACTGTHALLPTSGVAPHEDMLSHLRSQTRKIIAANVLHEPVQWLLILRPGNASAANLHKTLVDCRDVCHFILEWWVRACRLERAHRSPRHSRRHVQELSGHQRDILGAGKGLEHPSGRANERKD